MALNGSYISAATAMGIEQTMNRCQKKKDSLTNERESKCGESEDSKGKVDINKNSLTRLVKLLQKG